MHTSRTPRTLTDHAGAYTHGRTLGLRTYLNITRVERAAQVEPVVLSNPQGYKLAEVARIPGPMGAVRLGRREEQS